MIISFGDKVIRTVCEDGDFANNQCPKAVITELHLLLADMEACPRIQDVLTYLSISSIAFDQQNNIIKVYLERGYILQFEVLTFAKAAKLDYSNRIKVLSFLHEHDV